MSGTEGISGPDFVPPDIEDLDGRLIMHMGLGEDVSDSPVESDDRPKGKIVTSERAADILADSGIEHPSTDEPFV